MIRIIEEIVLYIVICNVIFIDISFWNEVNENILSLRE